MSAMRIYGRCAVLAAMLLAGCGEEGPHAEPAEPKPSAAAPAEAALPTSLPVADMAKLEALIAEASAANQVLVMDFWATWCVPCVAMLPELHAGLAAMGERVRPVTVTLDSPGEYEQKAITFLAEHQALEDAYLLVPNSEQQMAIGERWHVLTVPAILIFDTQGRLAGEFLAGGETGEILQRVSEVVEGGEKVSGF